MTFLFSLIGVSGFLLDERELDTDNFSDVLRFEEQLQSENADTDFVIEVAAKGVDKDGGDKWVVLSYNNRS